MMNGVVREVISSEFSGLTSMLASRIKYEIKLAWGFEDELKDLEKEVNELSKLLGGACSNPITNQVMDDWLKKIKNAVYDANNLLDEWSYDVLSLQLSTSSGSSSSSGCCDMDALVKYPMSRFMMGHKVRSLRNSIISIYKDGMNLGIKPIEVAAGEDYSNINMARRREIEKEEKLLHYNRECAGDDILVGREADQKQLVDKMLCDPNHEDHTNTHRLTVIGIVGLPGLGKTALTRRISKDERVTAYFNSLVIWLTVSHTFDLIDSLNKMVEILFEQNLNLTSRDALIKKLQEKMKGKKYLLILDDVWDTTFWESFRKTLHEIGGSNKGSMVLVTSRDTDLVARMKYVHIGTYNHPLNVLSEDDSWLLFKDIVNDDSLDYNEEKHEIAERMLKNCGGLPLAIRALGDLLRVKNNVEEWREIEESEVWMNQDEHGILPSLRLSYNYLPNEALKKCFAFCAIFKEDEVIIKNKLIYMWMAHGLLEPKNGKIMEQVGENYCKVLLNSSLFQEVEMDKYGNVKTFKMHDLVMSLARVVSKGECLHSNGECDGSNEVRHLSLPRFNRNLTKSCCMKLETLFHEDRVDGGAVRQLKECRRLRVLRIRGFWDVNCMLELLDNNFKHLRYLEVVDDFHITLNISRMEMMRRLQNVKLYQLQTLWTWIRIRDTEWLDESLTFIKGILMSNLVNLKHIYCYYDSIGIPQGLGRFAALQTLPMLDLEKEWGGRINELSSLRNLRGKLELQNLRYINSEEEEDTCNSLLSVRDNNIEHLILSWNGDGYGAALQQNSVAEALQPHSNLKRLEISAYFGTIFPSWLTETCFSLCNLVSLTIKHCPNVEGYLQMDNFSHLQYLEIDSCDKLTLTFSVEHGFNCYKLLEELYFCDVYCCLPDLTPLTKLRVLHFVPFEYEGELVMGLGSLPCLKQLRINQLLPADLGEHTPLCKSLQILDLDTDINFDSYQGWTWLGNFTALKILKFSNMEKVDQLPSQQVMQRLSNLHTFHVWECPNLKNDMWSKSGEWFKIAHIPNITLDILPIVTNYSTNSLCGIQ